MNNDKNIFLLENLIRKGLFSLANALHLYWPAYDDKGVNERNLTNYVAKEFQSNGFEAYFEVPFSGEKTDPRRLDCLLISPEHSLRAAIETKRLGNSTEIEGIINDIGRIDDFKLNRTQENIADTFVDSSYGIVLVGTWNSKYASWWCSDVYDELRDEKLDNLYEILEKERNAKMDGVTLYHDPDGKELHKGLYAVFQLNPK